MPIADHGTDPKRRPYVHILGNVTESDGVQSFKMEPVQYVAAVKHLKGTTPSASTFPLSAIIRDSARYKNGKPVPRVGSCVSFGGFITSVSRSVDISLPERFNIEIDNITFVGRGFVPSKISESSSKSQFIVRVSFPDQ